MSESVPSGYKTGEATPEWLRKARRTLGLNMTEMAAQLATRYRTYQNWELGIRPIPGVCTVAVRLLLEKDARLMQSIKNELNRKFSHVLPERAQKT